MPITRGQEKVAEKERGDGREFYPENHPRDEHGRFISKEEVDQSSDNNNGGKGSSSAKASEVSHRHHSSGVHKDQGGEKDSHASKWTSDKDEFDEWTGNAKEKSEKSTKSSSSLPKGKSDQADAEESDAREKLSETARSEVAKERPRDEQGRFLTDAEAGAG